MTELYDDTQARLTLIASPEALAATDLELEDLTDPDVRSVVWLNPADNQKARELLSEITAGEPWHARR
jgi:hypothetical protein